MDEQNQLKVELMAVSRNYQYELFNVTFQICVESMKNPNDNQLIQKIKDVVVCKM